MPQGSDDPEIGKQRADLAGRLGGESAFPGVKGGQGDGLLGAELGWAEAGGGETGQAFDPGLSGGGARAWGWGTVSRSNGWFGHVRPPEDRATPPRYSTRQGHDPPGAYGVEVIRLTVAAPEAPQRAQIIDLMQALKQSIEKAKPKQKAAPAQRKRKTAS